MVRCLGLTKSGKRCKKICSTVLCNIHNKVLYTDNISKPSKGMYLARYASDIECANYPEVYMYTQTEDFYNVIFETYDMSKKIRHRHKLRKTSTGTVFHNIIEYIESGKITKREKTIFTLEHRPSSRFHTHSHYFNIYKGYNHIHVMEIRDDRICHVHIRL